MQRQVSAGSTRSKVRKPIRLIDRGMPVSHAAQILGLRSDSLIRHLEKRGLYER